MNSYTPPVYVFALHKLSLFAKQRPRTAEYSAVAGAIHKRNEKALSSRLTVEGFLLFKKPGETYFHALGTIIGSESLTTVFGMGTGVAFPIWSPGNGARTGRGRTRPFGCFSRWQFVVSHQTEILTHQLMDFGTGNPDS